MCDQCDFRKMLSTAGISATKNRLAVLTVVGLAKRPLSAKDVGKRVSKKRPVNPVTVYRILDALSAAGLVERIAGGGRTTYYGLAPNRHHQAHPHFYCIRCGHINCLPPDTLAALPLTPPVDIPGRVEKVQVRIDGVCNDCIRG